MDEIELLKRRLERERQARKQAEHISESKTREIYIANQELIQLKEHLEDIVRTRTAEANRARDEALQASQTKSQFLANMSHELRTPLNAIIGYSEMLLDEAVEDGLTEMLSDLKKINSAGKHLLGLINDILDLSKIEAGKMDLYLETFDLASMATEVVSTVQPLIAKNDNTLVLQVEPGAGNCLADLTKVRQVLFNLLSNASKFCEKGRIELTISRETSGHRGDWIVITVSDTGIGMNQEQIEHLFQAFTQADASTTRKYGGTGLGLTISRHFCQMMGGDINVRSSLGQGSTFIMRIPAQVKVASNASPDSSGKHLELTLPLPSADASLILVIDDDPSARDLLRRFLASEGYRVETASSGEEGIIKATELRPDAITLDVMMPGMDGWAVLTALKRDPNMEDIPIIMLTMLDEANLGFSLGASDYLTKPINRDRLATVLARHRRNRTCQHALLVEDDSTTREMLERILTKLDMKVTVAENGAVALDRLRTEQPDMIFLDLMMPVMDGFQFLGELRAESRWKDIPVVVVTAKELTIDDRKMLNGQVGSILQKGSFSKDQLFAEVLSIARQNLTTKSGANDAAHPAG